MEKHWLMRIESVTLALGLALLIVLGLVVDLYWTVGGLSKEVGTLRGATIVWSEPSR